MTGYNLRVFIASVQCKATEVQDTLNRDLEKGIYGQQLEKDKSREKSLVAPMGATRNKSSMSQIH